MESIRCGEVIFVCLPKRQEQPRVESTPCAEIVFVGLPKREERPRVESTPCKRVVSLGLSLIHKGTDGWTCSVEISARLVVEAFSHGLLVAWNILADVQNWKRKLKVRKRAFSRWIGDPCLDTGCRPLFETGQLEGLVLNNNFIFNCFATSHGGFREVTFPKPSSKRKITPRPLLSCPCPTLSLWHGGTSLDPNRRGQLVFGGHQQPDGNACHPPPTQIRSMEIEMSVVHDVFDLHPGFISHRVARWAMAKVGVHLAVVAPKVAHLGFLRVGANSAVCAPVMPIRPSYI